MPDTWVPVARLTAALAETDVLQGVTAPLPEVVADVVDDSRRVTPGAAFVAVRGHALDGHQWIPAAARQGPAARAWATTRA